MAKVLVVDDSALMRRQIKRILGDAGRRAEYDAQRAAVEAARAEGDSVGGVRLDSVQGNVVSRAGNQVTLKGAFAARHDGEALKAFALEPSP